MNDFKGFFESKTVWGGIVGLLASVFALGRYALTPAEIADATNALVAIATAVGSLIAIYGRVKATKMIGVSSVMLLALGALSLLGSPVSATDMPMKAPTLQLPAPIQPLNATGFYLGVNAGGSFTGQEYDFVTLPGVASGQQKLYPAGFMAGATIGFGGAVGSMNAAFETDWDYDFTKASVGCGSATCASRNSLFFAQKIVIGAAIPTIAGAVPRNTSLTPPSQWPIPINLPSNFSMANLGINLVAGMAEHDIAASVTGAGGGFRWISGPLAGVQLKAAIAKNWNTKVEYDYIWFKNSFTPQGATGLFPATFQQFNEQRVTFGLEYHL